MEDLINVLSNYDEHFALNGKEVCFDDEMQKAMCMTIMFLKGMDKAFRDIDETIEETQTEDDEFLAPGLQKARDLLAEQVRIVSVAGGDYV